MSREELKNKIYPIIGGIEPKDWEFFCKDDAEKLADVAIQYAQLEAVSFAEWIDKKEFKRIDWSGKWQGGNFSESKTTQELYQIFLTQKG